MCLADFTASHVWLKHRDLLQVGIHRLPTFGRNLQTALTELICPTNFYSLPSLVEAVSAALFEHGAYP
jgi:hypothetical protein